MEFDSTFWLTQLKEHPQDTELWLTMAQKAEEAHEYRLACQGYLAAIRLDSSRTQAIERYRAARQARQKQCPEGAFQFEMLKLPGKVAVAILFGTMNMDVGALENTFKGLINQGFRHFICDCDGIQIFSGLGPSFLRIMQQTLQKIQGDLLLLDASSMVMSILDLKKIVIPNFTDMLALIQKISQK